MRPIDYLKDKVYVIILNTLGIVLLHSYLITIGNSISQCMLIGLTWVSLCVVTLLIDFYRRKKYFSNLIKTCKRLDKRYLIAEIMEKPQRSEDKIYAEVLRLANKSMMEEITAIKEERKVYKEYIEQWVHEIKTPLAAMQLICENDKLQSNQKCLTELERMQHLTEQVLFYARSETVEKDYFVKETELAECVEHALLANKKLLIGHGVHIEIEVEDKVYTDGKWLTFILNQLIQNSVKYGATEIKFTSRREVEGIILVVYDNGIGIATSDLPRVFDKGFVGINGRMHNKSTGIGLYLCHKLSQKLGFDMRIHSKVDTYTEVRLIFPTSFIFVRTS